MAQHRGESQESRTCFVANKDDGKASSSTTARREVAPSGPEEYDISEDSGDMSIIDERTESVPNDDEKPPGSDKIFTIGQHKGSTYRHIATNITG